MKNINTVNPNEQFGLLIQGPPKTGKTEFACCFPSPWVANADANLGGFARKARLQGFESDMCFSDIMRDDEGKNIVDKDGKPDAEKIWARFINETGKAMVEPAIKSIVFDSVTTLGMLAMSFIMADRVKRTGKGSKDISEIQDWNTHQNLWKTLIMRMRTSGKLVIFLCHEEGMKDEISGGVLKWVPNIPGGKLQAAFGGFFSDVWRTEVEERSKPGGIHETRYLIRTRPTSRLDLGGSVATKETTLDRPDSLAEQRSLIYGLLGMEETK